MLLDSPGLLLLKVIAEASFCHVNIMNCQIKGIITYFDRGSNEYGEGGRFGEILTLDLAKWCSLDLRSHIS